MLGILQDPGKSTFSGGVESQPDKTAEMGDSHSNFVSVDCGAAEDTQALVESAIGMDQTVGERRSGWRRYRR